MSDALRGLYFRFAVSSLTAVTLGWLLRVDVAVVFLAIATVGWLEAFHSEELWR